MRKQLVHQGFIFLLVQEKLPKNLPKFEAGPPDWIKKMWEADKNGNRILGSLSILDLGDEIKAVNPYHVFGCNFSIRKTTLLEAGGFHPDALPQELIKYRGDGESHVSRYILEKGYQALYHPKASVYHLVAASRLTVEYFCQRAYNEGISNSFIQIRNRYLRNSQHKYCVRKIVTSIKKIMRWLAVKLLSTIKQFHINDSRRDKKIQRRIKAAYQSGRLYHQELFKKDEALAAHVLRQNYLE